MVNSVRIIILFLFIINFAYAECKDKFLPINYLETSKYNLVNPNASLGLELNIVNGRYLLASSDFSHSLDDEKTIEQVNNLRDIYFLNSILSVEDRDLGSLSFFEHLSYAVNNLPCNSNKNSTKSFELLGMIPVGPIVDNTKIYVLKGSAAVAIVLPKNKYYETYILMPFRSRIDIQLMYLKANSLDEANSFYYELTKLL